MPLRVFNTLTRQKDDVVPLRGRRVTMFVCGITPYDHAHLGHAKTYVAFDVIARYLRPGRLSMPRPRARGFARSAQRPS